MVRNGRRTAQIESLRRSIVLSGHSSRVCLSECVADQGFKRLEGAYCIVPYTIPHQNVLSQKRTLNENLHIFYPLPILLYNLVLHIPSNCLSVSSRLSRPATVAGLSSAAAMYAPTRRNPPGSSICNSPAGITGCLGKSVCAGRHSVGGNWIA